jgi:hypothetical protein
VGDRLHRRNSCGGPGDACCAAGACGGAGAGPRWRLDLTTGFGSVTPLTLGLTAYPAAQSGGRIHCANDYEVCTYRGQPSAEVQSTLSMSISRYYSLLLVPTRRLLASTLMIAD